MQGHSLQKLGQRFGTKTLLVGGLVGDAVVSGVV